MSTSQIISLGSASIPIAFKNFLASLPTQSLLMLYLPFFSIRQSLTSLSISAPEIRYAPFFCILAISSSATFWNTKHSFSAIHGKLLSKLAPATISAPAFSTSAVSSTITGGFPAPAPIAFLPDDKRALTTPGPPVATSIRTIGDAIISFELSLVGFLTETTRFSGPPASWIALFTKSTA